MDIWQVWWCFDCFKSWDRCNDMTGVMMMGQLWGHSQIKSNDMMTLWQMKYKLTDVTMLWQVSRLRDRCSYDESHVNENCDSCNEHLAGVLLTRQLHSYHKCNHDRCDNGIQCLLIVRLFKMQMQCRCQPSMQYWSGLWLSNVSSVAFTHCLWSPHLTQLVICSRLAIKREHHNI